MGRDPDSNGSAPATVAVLGGGLAGLSAARCAIERGYSVTLVERRPFLGGRAFSFRDPQVGYEVDNGQHVFMGCCRYYLDFLRALGAVDKTYLQETLRAEVILNGKRGVLASASFLGRLHLLPSFIRYPHISLIEKLLALYGMVRVKLTDRVKHGDDLDRITFYQWLKRHHQSDRAIDNLWNVIILPMLNDDSRDASADMALMVLQEGLLSAPGNAAIGFARVGLTLLTGEPAQRFLEKQGGKLMLGKAVNALRIEGGRVTDVELPDGSLLQADAYISALPFDVLLQVLPKDVANSPFFSGIAMLTSSPIVGIHLWYDRPIMDEDFVAFLDSPVQWVFNRSMIQGSDQNGGQYVCISVSGAWDYVDRPKEELRELFASEMERLFPKARGAQIRRHLVVKQPQATFRSIPGASEHRPSQITPISNLFLAGEWTSTGWPSTMEGAVRSGVMAAEALVSRL